MKNDLASFYKEVGDRIREIRQQKGLSQEELAAKAQLSTPHISEIERGNKELRIASMCRIAEALETPTDYFLRPHIPATVQFYMKECGDLLEGCTPAQIELITRLVREIKNTDIT